MKTIFKTNLVIIALLLAMGINAQDKPLTFGIKAGANLSNLGGDDTEDLSAKAGFNAGVTLDFALASDLYLLTGLEYSTKGTKNGDVKLNLGYLQLPVHLGYKLEVVDGTKLVFHAGPYLGYAASGQWKAEGVSIDAFGDEVDQLEVTKLKRFDFGLGLGVGAELGKIGVGLGYDFGLANLFDTSEAKVRNMNAYLTVGYKF
ncbi:MAG: PorT family protein [Prevotella sp.]|jgi:hypothetical protein|nr:PorT family protein [Prevotella sp.]